MCRSQRVGVLKKNTIIKKKVPNLIEFTVNVKLCKSCWILYNLNRLQ